MDENAYHYVDLDVQSSTGCEAKLIRPHLLSLRNSHAVEMFEGQTCFVALDTWLATCVATIFSKCSARFTGQDGTGKARRTTLPARFNTWMTAHGLHLLCRNDTEIVVHKTAATRCFLKCDGKRKTEKCQCITTFEAANGTAMAFIFPVFHRIFANIKNRVLWNDEMEILK